MMSCKRGTNVDIYTALVPAHTFWKHTGMAPYSLKRKSEPDRHYAVSLYDKIMASTVILSIVALNIINVSYGVQFDVVSISAILKRSMYNIASLSYLLNMYYYKDDVITSIENLIIADSAIEREIKIRACPIRTRFQTICTILLLLAAVVAAFLFSILYENTKGKFPVLFFVYYYVYDILTVSVLTMLFYFLTEIKRMFHTTNNYLKTDISKRTSTCQQRKTRKLVEIEKIHRLLRNTSKTVNKIFEVVILAKVAVTSMYILVVIFRITSNLVVPIKYYKEIYVIWSSIHFFHVVTVVKLFSDIQNEVRHLFRQLKFSKFI